MFKKEILFFRQKVILACDGNCKKAFGISQRPSVQISDDPDDYAFLTDNEVEDAPAGSGIYEGGHAKPTTPGDFNKWCARECERASMTDLGKPIEIRDFSKRVYNQPWLHKDEE